MIRTNASLRSQSDTRPSSAPTTPTGTLRSIDTRMGLQRTETRSLTHAGPLPTLLWLRLGTFVFSVRERRAHRRVDIDVLAQRAGAQHGRAHEHVWAVRDQAGWTVRAPPPLTYTSPSSVFRGAQRSVLHLHRRRSTGVDGGASVQVDTSAAERAATEYR